MFRKRYWVYVCYLLDWPHVSIRCVLRPDIATWVSLLCPCLQLNAEMVLRFVQHVPNAACPIQTHQN
jgi:hypothetical protein